jgi:phosphoglycerate dehydrogenase-like enzyme
MRLSLGQFWDISSNMARTIWCNARLPADAMAELSAGVQGRWLIVSENLTNNLTAGSPDARLAEATIALGQPDPGQVIELQNLEWIHLTSAGYARYDRPEIRQALSKRGAKMSNSSSVFAEPCAQHALAFMMADARQIPRCVVEQSQRAWPTVAIRRTSRLLTGRTVLILGMGAIARRLIELLGPLRVKVIAVRQSVRGDEPVETHAVSELPGLLPMADHIVDILPGGPGTDRLFSSDLFSRAKAGAVFYNIGRGTTVDQGALVAALKSGRLRGAYLDVTDPEPPKANDPIWQAPNCHITPHTAGGHDEEFLYSVRHFLENLKRFESGQALLDLVLP